MEREGHIGKTYELIRDTYLMCKDEAYPVCFDKDTKFRVTEPEDEMISVPNFVYLKAKKDGKLYCVPYMADNLSRYDDIWKEVTAE